MPEGVDVAALLQFEADLIDAAGRIDREHELQIDGRLGGRPSGDGKQNEQRPPDGAPDGGASRTGVKAGVHCRGLDMSCPLAVGRHRASSGPIADKFGLKPIGNADGSERFRGSWRSLGMGHIFIVVVIEL
jgi:hypothetical protein